MASTVRVFVLWQYRVLGEALAHALGERPGVRVVGSSGDPRRAEERLAREPADVLLLDASVRPGVAVELVGDFLRRFADLKVMPFGLVRTEDVLPFFEVGASGYLPGDASLEETVAAVVEGDGGRALWPLELAAELAGRIEELSAGSGTDRARGTAPGETRVGPLSPREGQVLGLLAQGLANKEIARELGIRTTTVKNHVHAVLTKLGAKRRRGAVRRAFEHGLLDGPFRWCPLDRAPCPLPGESPAREGGGDGRRTVRLREEVDR